MESINCTVMLLYWFVSWMLLVQNRKEEEEEEEEGTVLTKTPLVSLPLLCHWYEETHSEHQVYSLFGLPFPQYFPSTALALTHSHMHAHTHTRMHAHTYTHTHTHAHTHKQTHTYTHTHTHTHTHIHTHTHTHTHAQTTVYIQPQSIDSFIMILHITFVPSLQAPPPKRYVQLLSSYHQSMSCVYCCSVLIIRLEKS